MEEAYQFRLFVLTSKNENQENLFKVFRDMPLLEKSTRFSLSRLEITTLYFDRQLAMETLDDAASATETDLEEE